MRTAVAELEEEPEEITEEPVVEKTAAEPSEQEEEKETGKGFVLPLVIILAVGIGGVIIFLIVKKIRDDDNY